MIAYRRTPGGVLVPTRYQSPTQPRPVGWAACPPEVRARFEALRAELRAAVGKR